ncbi:MAG: MerR family transcriptional regulator [Actinomycetes bacterium]
MLIGQVARAAGTTTKALRFYEQQGLLPPPSRTPGGYRDYPTDVLSRLEFIARARRAGLALAQVREVLAVRDAGQAPCSHVRHLLDDRLEDLDARIAELAGLREAVAALRAAAGPEGDDACDARAVCRYL